MLRPKPFRILLFTEPEMASNVVGDLVINKFKNLSNFKPHVIINLSFTYLNIK